jgi:hypothetical protein
LENRSRRLEIGLAVIAIVIGIAPLVLPNAEALLVLGIAVAVILLAVALWVALPRSKQLDANAGLPMTFSFIQATSEDLIWIADLQKRQFHGDAVPLEILREWYSANPNGFIVIRDAKGTRVGHIDVLPVREEPFRLFVEGKITERGIRGTSLVGIAERLEVRDLYVESVVVSSDKDVRKAAVGAILANLDEIFGHVAEPPSIRYVYGLAATKAGQEFMERWGFEIASKPELREDKHPLYRTLYNGLKLRLHS